MKRQERTIGEDSDHRRPKILGMHVDATSYDSAVQSILTWARSGLSRYVCVANVHMVMESYDDPSFRTVINNADMVTPDGMPLVWMIRLMGGHNQERVFGSKLTLQICEAAARHGIPVGFFGSTPQINDKLLQNLMTRFLRLKVAYVYSPPFRPLTAEEDTEIVESINSSGAAILFVGLGCPKQERWIAEHKNRVNAVMLGVGAAFDFIAGTVRQAPPWMQRMGLEWLFRLILEPKRLCKRYMRHNPRFVAFAIFQLLGVHFYGIRKK
jgi:N-acetylglucosaminyldiphosphoundecaprenol N-acetyl-beta-D-mannosaminyltransferase